MMATISSISAKPSKLKAQKAKKLPITAAEKALSKLQNDHRSAIRSSFTKAGFHRVSGVSDKEFTYDNQKTDLDDVFVYENVIILAEYTCKQASDVGEHLKLKKHIYDKILADPEAFLIFLAAKFPGSADQLASGYHVQKTIVRVLYCSSGPDATQPPPRSVAIDDEGRRTTGSTKYAAGTGRKVR